ncbi:hypothetical protein HELRODRAFT_178826 [Helobdella robusta]|uniref:SCP domain-containing protein n=1 Tax=Helobdella robusta TaxID=6412 RepID=T1FDS8_HELRO|nr:hypothetical protein HELRODRAFT_178826 [Helobdella robusta]ESN95911.1 hypothetical protein HELRODRAFT_178826 [Helobdella robusta]
MCAIGTPIQESLSDRTVKYLLDSWLNDRHLCLESETLLQCRKFTNMACADTSRFGCAMYSNTSSRTATATKNIITCFYRPRCTPSYNPFKEGLQCTSCPEDAKACEGFLCSVPDGVCPTDCRDLFEFNCTSCRRKNREVTTAPNGVTDRAGPSTVKPNPDNNDSGDPATDKKSTAGIYNKVHLFVAMIFQFATFILFLSF